MKKINFCTTVMLLLPTVLLAQNETISTDNWVISPGIIGTLVLIAIVLIVAVFILAAKISTYADELKRRQLEKKRLAFNEEIIGLEGNEIDEILEKRKKALQFKLSGRELGSDQQASDEIGLINKVTNEPDNPLFDEKKSRKSDLKHPIS